MSLTSTSVLLIMLQQGLSSKLPAHISDLLNIHCSIVIEVSVVGCALVDPKQAPVGSGN